ncbi:MAG TPA: type II toxin-antitoxin system VapC family toxin [Pseudolabrys sp.]|nr:type II toxin-antitoxin system VapC family toxin [Pseudolabrys sp.]
MIVIDASAAVALLLDEDAKFPNIGSLSELAEDSLAAPSHWPAELGNALVSNVRRRRLARDEIARLMDQIERMGVEILPPPSPAETALIAEQALDLGLTFYDAAYIRLALTSGASLLTLDRQMRDVAEQLEIPMLPS